MVIRLLLAALLLLSISACKPDGGVPVPNFLGGGEEVAAATATELDSLAAQGAFVSVSGTVLEQDGREVLLDDGTGLIRVELPEQPPLMTGHRLLASGRLSDDDGAPRLRAAEWLYDSTAVPVHSD